MFWSLNLFSLKIKHFYTRADEHMGIFNLTGKRLKKVKQYAISDHLLQCNCAINFDDFSILATDCNKFKLLLRETLLIKRDKQDNKIVSIGTLWLRWQFYFQYHIIADFVLIYNSNFIPWTDRAKICFKCYVKEKRKSSLENALVEKSKSSTNLEWIILSNQFKYSPSWICLATWSFFFVTLLDVVLQFRSNFDSVRLMLVESHMIMNSLR